MSNAMTSMHFITIIIPTIYRIVYLIFITSFLLNPIFGDIVKLHTVHCTSSIATNSCYIIKLHTQSIFWLVQICWNGENSIWTCTRFVRTVPHKITVLNFRITGTRFLHSLVKILIWRRVSFFFLSKNHS